MTTIGSTPTCLFCDQTVAESLGYFPSVEEGLPPVIGGFSGQPVAMHWSCFFSWEGHADFARTAFEREVQNANSSTYLGLVILGERVAIYVTVNEPFWFSVILRSTGRIFHLREQEWFDWCRDVNLATTSAQPIEALDLLAELPPILNKFSSRSAIDAETDWSHTERHLYRS